MFQLCLGRILNRLHPLTFSEAEQIVFALTVDPHEIFRISHDLPCFDSNFGKNIK